MCAIRSLMQAVQISMKTTHGVLWIQWHCCVLPSMMSQQRKFVRFSVCCAMVRLMARPVQLPPSRQLVLLKQRASSKRRRAVFRVGDKSWSLIPMLHRDAISTLNLLPTSHRLHEVRVRLNTVIRLNSSLVPMSLTVWLGYLFRHCSALPARAENLLSS